RIERPRCSLFGLSHGGRGIARPAACSSQRAGRGGRWRRDVQGREPSVQDVGEQGRGRKAGGGSGRTFPRIASRERPFRGPDSDTGRNGGAEGELLNGLAGSCLFGLTEKENFQRERSDEEFQGRRFQCPLAGGGTADAAAVGNTGPDQGEGGGRLS